jgi:hypothetical protein
VTPHDPITWALYGLGLPADARGHGADHQIARQSWKTYLAEREPVRGASIDALSTSDENAGAKSLPRSLAKRNA